MNSFLKIYLPLFLVGYILVAFVLPSYRTYKQTGINPLVFGSTDNAHDYIGLIMKWLIAFLFIIVFVFSCSNYIYQFFVPITYLQYAIITYVGLAIMHIALIWISIAQYQMQQSWRIGIDEQHKTDLITKGIFSISRNPIFLGMIITVVGLFLVLPSALSLCITICTYIVIQIQIRLEESFLSKQHGDKYHNYICKVRRLL
jgi:protein-S-isoprenylcysteine O-methyltransferase Ste14